MAIISNIFGGLGNQMFQYAMAKAVSVIHNTELLLDIGLFVNYELHNGYELDRVFNIPTKIASKSQIKNCIGWRSTRIGRKILKRKELSFLRGENYYLEDDLAFNADVFSLPSNCYLEGYWQSESYFKDIEKIIRANFVFRKPLLGQNAEIADKIRISNSVSLHVRRGDYMANHSIHFPCTVDYYNQAMRYIDSHLSNPVYFLFSDDIEWARENLLFNSHYYFINNNVGSDSYNDMHLMSLCDHHIIANSSFSWWGAWLNSCKDKMVIAPRRWFHTDAFASHDIVPKSWMTV